MPNINAVLNEQIRRLSRREIRGNTKLLKRATSHYRRDIAALKRQVGQLTRLVSKLQKAMPSPDPSPAPEVIQKARLRIDGLKAHRARLGLSAKEYGKLMGVSGLTIYNWEAGKSKPRRSQLGRIISVRGIGKREAAQRLGHLTGEVKPSTAPQSSNLGAPKRRKYSHTAEEMVLRLLKSGKPLSRSDLNSAWEKEGRPGTADVILGLLVKKGKIQRTKSEGQTKSNYRLR
jgi:DNA-binding transcriptional regulator YiaG